MNEPLCGLQKASELLLEGERLFREAAQTDDPVRRLVLAFVGQLGPLCKIKTRKKKPFNPMLGETFEFVSEHFRFLGEKVQHNPNNVLAFHMEGKDYTFSS